MAKSACLFDQLPECDGRVEETRQLIEKLAGKERVVLESYQPFRLLWIKVIIRAAFDYALYKDSRDLKYRKWALDAERWLFESSYLLNSLESVCHMLGFDPELWRQFARRVTRSQVRKMEFLERSGKDLMSLANLATKESEDEEEELEEYEVYAH